MKFYDQALQPRGRQGGKGLPNENANRYLEPEECVGVAKLSSQVGGANALNEFVKVK